MKNRVGKRRIGKIDISSLNVPPEKHEFNTARYFAELGYDIEFVKPRYIQGQRNPDFMMNGKTWEVKGPIRYSDSTLEFNLKKAMKQSENIIFDLRRLNERDEKRYLDGLIRRAKVRRIISLIVITRNGDRVDIKGGI